MKQWMYWGGVGSIIILAAALRFWGLGNNSFVADEFLDINSSYGYHQTGQWRAWDFNKKQQSEVNINEPRDERAALYKWQVAQLFAYLPPTEAVARSISVLWGIVTVLLIIWSTVVFTRSREVSLVAGILAAVSISLLVTSRRLRMYAFFVPVYLALATSIYLLLEGRAAAWWQRFSQRFLGERDYSVNLWWALPALGLLVLSYHLHQLTLNIFFAVLVYCAIMAWYEHRYHILGKYSTLTTVGVAGFILLYALSPVARGLIQSGFIFFDDHYSYLAHVSLDWWHPLLGFGLVAFGAASLIRRQGTRHSGWYLATMFLVPLLLAIFCWRRNVGPQYVIFLQPFAIILVAAGVYSIWLRIEQTFHAKWMQRTLLVGLILLVPNFGYFLAENNTYHETNTSSNPNYRKIWTYIKHEYAPGEALLTRNFRNYYWSELGATVYDLGSETNRTKMQESDFVAIQKMHAHGWVVLSSNDLADYISPELRRYFEANLSRVSNSALRGDVIVYRW